MPTRSREELRVKRSSSATSRRSCASSRTCPCSARGSGRSSRRVRAALAGGCVRGARRRQAPRGGHELEPDEVLVERAGRDGWAVAANAGVTVALDTAVDDELAARATCARPHPPRQLDAEGGGARADRPDLAHDPAVPRRTCSQHADWITRETLAVSVDGRRAAVERAARPRSPDAERLLTRCDSRQCELAR